MHAEMDPYRKRKIIKRHAASFEEKEDYIAVEKRLKVSLNGKDFITLHCTPLMIKELVVGLFLTEGIIHRNPSGGHEDRIWRRDMS